MYIQLLINDHDPDLDLWSWGGEPIYRDGIYCGQTTTTAYGFTFKKQVPTGKISQYRLANLLFSSGFADLSWIRKKFAFKWTGTSGNK